MQIRRLDRSDGQLLKDAVSALLSHGHPADTSAEEDHLVRALADPTCYFLLGVDGEQMLGYLSAFQFPNVQRNDFLVYLYDIVVHPEHRRCGIGRRLVEALKQCCKVDNVATIWVGTSLQNRAARRMFEATGAERISETYAEYVYAI